VIVDLRDPALALPHEPWDKAPQQAVILPIMQHAQTRATGVFVAGINPYRAFDVAYRGFIDLVAGLIAGGLANARAYEAECRRAEALAEIDRAKTAFFSNASHEFRTPLTLVISPLKDLLVRSAGADHIVADKHEVELIHRNCLRLLKLVNTLLDFSRIEAGRVQALYEPVDLAAYTVELASAFRSAMDQAGLDFVVDCPPLPEPVYVDRDMWEKIVLNLVSNAFKYTLEGKVVVALRLAADARMVKLIVRDTGIGIPEAEMPRLFERFHRVAGQGGRTQEGTGIGLALVQELARLHGGTVQVQSALARGTIFTISIPLGKAHLPADRIDGARTVPPTGVRAEAFVEEALRWLPGAENAREIVVERELISPHPERPSSSASRQLVLLADDNADMRDYVCRLLGTHYDIEPVADGQAALEAARRRRPDLVLSDVMMPGLDGFGLLHALRADPQLRELPVILLSARAGEEAKVEGLEAGADDYLVKPFSARELLARIATNLETAHIRGEAAAELRHLNETLEQRVTTEIKERLRLEDAFRQAQKMEAIGQLTGGIAHDFNNLLQIIIGNVEALRRRARRDIPQGDEEFRRFIDAVARGADRAAMLTQQLLAFSRRQPLTPRLIDVNKLVTGMSELLRRTLGESIRIETILAGGMWRISADENQLENAILNLAVNARDAMPSGGRLMIETANAQLDDSYADAQDEIRAGDYAMIAVTDTGIGMSKDVVTNAFDPFFTTKEVGQGTGLGLSQVYGFLKQSGGHVKIYSEPGVGTTVKLFLPRVVTGDIVTDEVPDVRRIPTGSKSELVLVVEDDPDVRTYSTDMLRELGYGVLQAADGRTALRVLEIEAGIRLLFTDVGLPGGLNGRQLAAEGRRRLPRLKVLFTTGYAGSALVHDDKLDANVELITKPFTYAVLAAKVRELLDKSQLVS
jgi:signal transduction histidine kinase